MWESIYIMWIHIITLINTFRFVYIKKPQIWSHWLNSWMFRKPGNWEWEKFSFRFCSIETHYLKSNLNIRININSWFTVTNFHFIVIFCVLYFILYTASVRVFEFWKLKFRKVIVEIIEIIQWARNVLINTFKQYETSY